MYVKYFKRPLDLFCSVLAIILFSPVLLVTSILIRASLGRPVLFRQKRIGMNDREFTIYKFRTLTDHADQNGLPLPDEQRLTKIGRFLRSTGIDELPELFNIIKGDMSLVGPRSLPAEYLPFYTKAERVRHQVRGGLIPPEVLYGDVLPTWARQFEYEAVYATQVSLILDLKIIFAAFRCLFQRNKLNYGGFMRTTLIKERKNEKNRGKSME